MIERFLLVLNKDGLFDFVIILGGINDFGLFLNKDGEFLFWCLRFFYELVFWYLLLFVVVIILEIGYEVMDWFIVLREKCW